MTPFAVSQFSATICAQHRLRVVEERARRRADLLVVEEQRIGALDLPGREERRPVDVGDELGDRIVAERPRAEEARPRRRVRGPVDREAVGARLDERDAPLVGESARVALRDLAVFVAHRVDVSPLAPRPSRFEATPTARLASRTCTAWPRA